MEVVRENGLIVYKSPWALPVEVPENVNAYHALKGDPTDERFTSTIPTWIDGLTRESITLQGQFQRAEYLGRALLTIPSIASCKEDAAPKTIGILSPNHLDYPTVVIASLQIGVPFAAMSSASKVLEVEHFIRTGSITAIVVHPSLLRTALAARSAFKQHIPIVLMDNDPQEDFPTLPQLVEKGKGLKPLPPATVPKCKLAWVVFSSGTTAMPKAVQITHRNVLAYLLSNKTYTEKSIEATLSIGQKPAMDPSERTITLGFLPMYHAFGLLYNCVRPCLVPTTNIITSSWNISKALQNIEHYKVNFLAIVPTIAVQLIHSPLVKKTDLSTIRGLLCGAAYLSPEMRAKLEDVLTERGAGGGNGIRLKASNGHGMSECVVACASAAIEGMKCGPSPVEAIGVLIPGLDGRIVDPETGKDIPLGSGKAGELLLRGPQVMLGYGDPKANESAFVWEGGSRWLRTGDEFKLDEKGFLWYMDRLKEVFKSKGLQVTPTEIIAVINQLPFVFDSAVAGMPSQDPATGEEAWAWVVLEEGGKKMGEAKAKERIKEAVKSKLAKHKWLKEVIIIDAIPAVPSGKKLTRQLKQEALNNLKHKAKL
ncbi:acetyl-CoA synthetase-like protein [Atractiella rhizophila]|nr:acetyl-CoA synthetase-like protein [Atractiella rhizophila]